MLLPLLLLRAGFAWILLLIYLYESLLFGFGIFKNSVKKPRFTFKTALLSLLSCTLVAWFLFNSIIHSQTPAIFSFLLFDITTPLIISGIVLLIQPFFVVARNIVLQKAKKKMAKYPNIKVIAITGSYGKTSTKEFLTTILAAKFKVLATPEHKNSEMGIAQTILKDLKPEHGVFIVEMGSYNRGGIKLLCDIVKPHIGIVTGVNEQHLATFGSLENLLSAEGGQELVKSLPKGGLILLNGDNTYCLDLYKKIYNLSGGELKKNIYTLQKNKIDSDIWTEDIVVEKNRISFIARSKDGQLAHFAVPVLGKHNVQNLLGAILIAKAMGMSFGEISEACNNIQQKQAGMTLQKGIYGINIIDSSYSSNPDGVIADLDYLNIFGQPASAQGYGRAKKVIVMPCLIELGSKSIENHIQIGKKIAQVCDMAIITTKDRFKEIKMSAVMNGMAENRILLCNPAERGYGPLSGPTNSEEILTHITTFCKEGDAVLLEGGRPKELIKLLYGK